LPDQLPVRFLLL